MNVQWVILWSDAFVWLLVSLFCVMLFKRNETLCTIVSYLKSTSLGQLSSLILMLYMSIAVLDSIHYRDITLHETTGKHQIDNDVKSVLDRLLHPLDESLEKTYSSPFSRHLFVKETMINADGQVMQFYPKLNYPSALEGSHEMWELVLHYTWLSTALWLLLSSTLMGLVKFKNQTTINQWLACRGSKYLLLNWFILIWAVVMCFGLSRYFHIFGTDKVGHDVFYQAVKSIRSGILIGMLTLSFVLPFAVLLGTAAGYLGKRWDDAIQYIYTTISAVPSILLISAAILAVQIYVDNHLTAFSSLEERSDLRLILLCVILGLTSWTSLCRLIRAETMKIKAYDFITAARLMGVSSFSIIIRHIIPNLRHIIVISIVLDFSALVLAEAVLSYVGVGLSPTTYSWGNMIHSARMELAREPVIWWRIGASFAMMFTLVLAANIFADRVRDALDPKFEEV